jgi:hypothetical protein
LSPVWPVHNQDTVRRTGSNWLRKEPPVSCVASPQLRYSEQNQFQVAQEGATCLLCGQSTTKVLKLIRFQLAQEGATCLLFGQSITKVRKQNLFQLAQEGAIFLLCGQSTTRVLKLNRFQLVKVEATCLLWVARPHLRYCKPNWFHTS